MPVMVAFAGMAKPKFVAFSASEKAVPVPDTVVFEPSFAVILPGFVQAVAAPPPVAPAPEKVGPAVPGLEAAQAADEVNDPLPPWHRVMPVVGGGELTVIEPLAVILPQPPVKVTV